jgi:hypothetical protein
MLDRAGFAKTQTSIVYKEEKAPHFQTLLAVAHKLS